MSRFLFVISCIFLTFIAHKCKAQNQKIAITNITVFTEPNKEPLKNTTILISGGKIKKIGSSPILKIPLGYEIIDGKDKYLTAGFWNSHVHLIEPKWNEAKSKSKEILETQLQNMFASRGFTYVFDLAQINFENLNNLRSRIKNDKIKSPTILAVGIPFTSKSPFYIEPLKLPEFKTNKEVKTHLNNQIKKGANGIKIWSASPTGTNIDYLSAELIQEAAKFTKRKKLPLFAHPSNLKGTQIAIDNGVNVLAHVAADDRLVWDAKLVEKMIQNKVALIPTLKLHFWDLRQAGVNTENNKLITTAIKQLEVFNKAGGLVLFGTDTGYMNDYDIIEELVEMQNAGMTFDQILASLTTNPSQKFNFNRKTATIEVGKNADLVILKNNPSDDIHNFSSVEITIHNGIIIFKKTTNLP